MPTRYHLPCSYTLENSNRPFKLQLKVTLGHLKKNALLGFSTILTLASIIKLLWLLLHQADLVENRGHYFSLFSYIWQIRNTGLCYTLRASLVSLSTSHTPVCLPCGGRIFKYIYQIPLAPRIFDLVIVVGRSFKRLVVMVVAHLLMNSFLSVSFSLALLLSRDMDKG